MMRTFDPKEALYFVTISEEIRTLEQMFEEQDCSDIIRRLESGEKYVVVVIELSVYWGGFAGTSCVEGMPMPEGEDEKIKLAAHEASHKLFPRAVKDLKTKVAGHGWQAEFPVVTPDDIGRLALTWA